MTELSIVLCPVRLVDNLRVTLSSARISQLGPGFMERKLVIGFGHSHACRFAQVRFTCCTVNLAEATRNSYQGSS